MQIKVDSEIGKINGVIIHTPGNEVQNMTPSNAERALYSDILNLAVASKEYKQFKGVLKKFTEVFEVTSLLLDILKIPEAKNSILDDICINENATTVKDKLISLRPKDLARQLIEGVPLKVDNLTKYLSYERYTLQPLHNMFFTRDPSMAIGGNILIAKMKSVVREREAIIMQAIFNHHPNFKTKTISPINDRNFNVPVSIEGGDVLIARDDILLIGTGARTSTQGIDWIIECIKQHNEKKHIIVQVLPLKPESFIHLDMVFTLLGKDKCLIYEPVVYNQHDFETVHIYIENGDVEFIREEKNIMSALRKLGMDLEPISCGGGKDEWIQEREQWHSGTNFFAIAPDKLLGYDRNAYTLEEMNSYGYEILKAKDVVEGKINIDDYKQCLITIDGSELPRGGGGCRCMTMPVNREKIDW
ncbi:MAG: hypothetical protein K9J16_00270 [Melioribacteraceae bacterium]|nr:hypothetical protein [Melioribacteraceae bacterium]MCF8355022.1 hypothetical protein [Melioribacteraceae bacterium]MCF8392701.1 hypothetical protein [Melioribacteraceae bacterium]MCF8417723.1 hypothetical protein [Melioribacteraceae bacterium]